MKTNMKMKSLKSDGNEVKRICKKYGIETVEKEGYPIYMGKEMDENFSFSEMMHEPVILKSEAVKPLILAAFRGRFYR